jgi:hypothetical protein
MAGAKKMTNEVKLDKAAQTSKIAFDDESKRLDALASKTARLRALREASEATRGAHRSTSSS